MAKSDYKRVLKQAERELAEEKREAQLRAVRIARLEQTVASLRALVNPDVESDLGLTDTIRQVLKTASHPLRALDVREALSALGNTLQEHSNAMASVHAILARLHKSTEVMELNYGGKDKRYWWVQNGPPPRVIGTTPAAITVTGHAPEVAIGTSLDAANTVVQALYAQRRSRAAATHGITVVDEPAIYKGSKP